MFTQSLSGSWSFRQRDTKEWLPATVPGGVHTDLLALGKIPDPFVGDNEKKVQWIPDCDWEYRRTFTATPEALAEARQFIVCDGLDTLAEVSLNGKLLGKTDNFYRQWRWDVTGLFEADENEISILFRSPVAFIREREATDPLGGVSVAIPGGPHLRKPPYHWGWDWGPQVPAIGIWQDLRIESYSHARLADVHVRQSHQNGSATLSADLTVEQWQATDLHATLKVTAPNGQPQTVETELASGIVNLKSKIQNPLLWWPNGYGEQNLYQLEVTLHNGTTTLDSRSFQIGLRTLELRREPDAWGESFTFIVNAVPIFAKGANWIPADSFIPRTTNAQLEYLIKTAADAHMNMLRVWGGGIYEEERFYDLCDRYGILVWQDFAFACSIYPADDAFAENVRIEAVENVRRLRHRASLALWCGNNEMEQGWVEWGWNKPSDARNQRLKAGYDRIYHHLLPAITSTEDPDRPYWPSSASSGIPFAEPSSDQRGDMHYWEVWHARKPFTAYRQQYPRFMSEFGFQALPTYKTIQSYAEPADQNMNSYIMEHHQRSGAGNGLMLSQMTDTFRAANSFQSLVYLSMLLQAEGIRYGVEHWRRNRQRVSGTLIWQLNDCWPVASWASVDYFGRWKALHYAAKRFYAPILLSVEDDATRMSVHVTSDSTLPFDGLVRWRLERLDGTLLANGEQPVSAASLSNTPIVALDFADKIHDDNCRVTIFVCELWQGDQRLSTTVSTFAPSKYLELSEPGLNIETTLADEEDTLIFNVFTSSLARFVELELEGEDVIFSDNYFDLPATQSVQITASLPKGWSLQQARQALKVRSLYNSFA